MLCDTRRMAKKGRRAANEERLIAVQMHENGMSVPQIAEIMDVGRSTVFAWIDKYRRGGLAAMSTKRPLCRSWKQDPERVERWKREEYPVIRARAAAEGATILFADEASVRTDYHAGTTGAPVGQTPVVISSAVRHSVKIVSAVGQRGELSFQVHEGSMNAQRFIEFLASLLHDVDTPLFLIVNGSSVHKAKIVKKYVASTRGRLELFFLPPYSPELNPDEWVNKNVKHDRIARAVPLTRDDLKAVAVEALKRLKTCPRIVRRFFGDPKLAYIHA